jgi:serine/threonine protein phosphatase 1
MLNETLAPAALPPGLRIYAIGDVHGCDDRLARLHDLIADDLRRRPPTDSLLIHLGDYVDRGKQSAAVVARLAGDPLPGVPCINLMGNHEQMMLAALDCLPAAMAEGVADDPVWHWISNQGVITLQSWGLSPAGTPAEWRAGLPAAHLAFLRSLRPQHRVGPYLFVHAGLRPGVALEWQGAYDVMWIREPFLSWEGDLGVGAPGLVVVHGHTPTRTPDIRPHRIGVDTGAVAGGALTCLVLEEARMGFLSVPA